MAATQTCYVVTCTSIDLGKLETIVLNVFFNEDDAEQYLKEHQGSEPTYHNYEIHEADIQ